MKHIHILLILILTIFFTNCNVIRPGRVGVKQRLGKLDNKVYKEGIVFF
jgi:regulator of protease activity HflC (stomatin/prohibitin superfamily)